MNRAQAAKLIATGIEGVVCIGGCGASPPGGSLEVGAQTVDEPEKHRSDGGASDSSGVDAGDSADAADAADAADDAAVETVACYTEGFPTNTCTLPVACCFSDYSSQHDGYCSTDPCPWGTLTCDGPEDCTSGGVCCANPLFDSTDGSLIGYRVACQPGPCGSSLAVRELCHPTGTTQGTCSSASAQCVSAYGNDNDLPPILYVCM